MFMDVREHIGKPPLDGHTIGDDRTTTRSWSTRSPN